MILYEDNHIIVAVKPHMMPCQADSSKDLDFLSYLKNYIKEKYNKPGNVYLGLVHRLDRPVGGVMVFARTSKAASRLSNSMRKNEFEKVYYAVVEGKAPGGLLEDYLLKDTKTNMVKVVPKDTLGSKYAALEYQTQNYSGGYSLLRIRLITGRPHQIRVQLASRGMSIVGDMRYGKGEGEHILLWAYSLTFPHPITKEAMTFTAQPEWEFSSIALRALLEQISKA